MQPYSDTAARAPARSSLCCALALMLAGCVQTTPNWERHFGEAARATLAAQVIAPRAGAHPDPVAGMDGGAARSAYERYQRGFAVPAPQPAVFAIGVSGAK